MSNYTENKKTLDKIRNKYGCKGDIIFRTAIQYVVECGQQNFQDDEWVKEQLDIADKKHDAFEREKKVLFISREFEKSILECAAEIAKVNTYDLLIYIQKEVWLSGDGMDYQRAKQLLKRCMSWLEEDIELAVETLDVFESLGFTDDEIAELGYEHLLNYEEE